jgi:HTH-type transcriptional regulator/antitoxin HigA
MNHIKLIKTKHDHEQALARLMSLMDLDVEPNSAESDELDVLALLIEKYEQEMFPIDPPSPVEAIKFRMEQQGLIKKDLIPYIGSAPKVTEVLNGTRNLSINMIRKLHQGLGISLDVLIKEPAHQKAIAKNIDWNAFPIAEMRSRGYFEGFSGSLKELREYCEEKLTAFISSVPNGFELQPALLKTSAHLRSNDKETDEYALWAWQIRVLEKAYKAPLIKKYIKHTVNLGWMRKLAQLSWSEQGPLLAKEYLNKHGIHLIIEPHLPKTYLDGAVCLTHKGNPVVALTLRHDRLDNFWFSLMHELAHIAWHLDETQQWFLDDLDAHGGDEVEQEADALAQEALIPKETWDIDSLKDATSVRLASSKLGISPCIVAGRVRYESGDHKVFGKVFRKVFREKVKHHFSL